VTLLILIATIFLLTFLLTSMLSYWFLGGSSKKHLLTRIQAIQEATVRHDEEALKILKSDLKEDTPFLRRWLATLPGIPEVSLFMEQAALKMEAETFIVLTLGIFLVSLLVQILVGIPVLAAVILALAVGGVPSLVVYLRRSARFRKFEELFPDAIDQLARAVRAGHAFTSGFELIGQELPDPVGQEFRTTYAQQNLGVPFSVALKNFAIRVPLPDVRFFVAAVEIQRESGGNLGEVLDSLAAVVRDRFKLLRQVRVYTAEGRMSMYALMAMPFIAALGMFLLNPDYMAPLFFDPRGQKTLLVAATMQVIGFLIIRKMIKIKV
jgi:tight adherence protein B